MTLKIKGLTAEQIDSVKAYVHMMQPNAQLKDIEFSHPNKVWRKKANPKFNPDFRYRIKPTASTSEAATRFKIAPEDNFYCNTGNQRPFTPQESAGKTFIPLSDPNKTLTVVNVLKRFVVFEGGESMTYEELLKKTKQLDGGPSGVYVGVTK